jgi:transcription elongation factor B subunit 1
LYYKWFYEGSTTEIPEFKVDPEIVLEVLMTADFLEC